jgi:hypothetical protein
MLFINEIMFSFVVVNINSNFTTMTTSNASGKHNTLTHETIRLDHCTININLSNPSDFDKFKHFIKNLTFKKQPNENT